MLMTSVTDLRRNIKSVLEQVIAEKTPAVILQRSKPVAYIVDAESFHSMQSTFEYSLSDADAVLKQIDVVRDKIAKEGGIQPDSVRLIRDLRSGKRRD
ncbi:MAG: type II toxin-antitoxin system Phd/YefM family antitoxin [Bacillota bacterium]